MGKDRLEAQPHPPSADRILQTVQERTRKVTLPKIDADEAWRRRSRHADIVTCPPGGCPKPGDW